MKNTTDTQQEHKPAWKTAITEIGPNTIRVRGYAVDELMGQVSFARVIYLVLRGELPTEPQGRLLDAMLVSCIDHGATPPSTLAARTAVSTGAPLNAALAAGLLSINTHHGGAIEDSMQVLLVVNRKMQEEGLTTEAAVEEVVEAHRYSGKRVPGFGHRLHAEDPRTARLLHLADEAGVSGEHLATCRALETVLEQTTGRQLPLNVDGAIAAVLCELGFAPELANAFFMMARLPGLVAHVMEERTRQKPVRRIHPTHHEYDGPNQRALS